MGERKKRKPPGLDRTSQKSDVEKQAGDGAEVRLFQTSPGDAPLIEFMWGLKLRDQMVVLAAIEALKALGHRMRPPQNEHLGDQLYYLRFNGEDGTFRVFYWPFGKGVVVVGHGFSKKSQACPPAEIERAKKHRSLFQQDPEFHTYRGTIDGGEDDK